MKKAVSIILTLTVILVSASLLFAHAEESEETVVAPLIPRAARWEYLTFENTDMTAAAPNGWLDGSDGRNWSSGQAPFAAPQYAKDISNTLFDLQYYSAFLRITFHLENVAAIKELSMDVIYDEDPILYLNGTQIWTAEGYHDRDYLTDINLDSALSALKEGENILCVAVHNEYGGGLFDLSLTATGEDGLIVKYPMSRYGTGMENWNGSPNIGTERAVFQVLLLVTEQGYDAVTALWNDREHYTWTLYINGIPHLVPPTGDYDFGTARLIRFETALADLGNAFVPQIGVHYDIDLSVSDDSVTYIFEGLTDGYYITEEPINPYGYPVGLKSLVEGDLNKDQTLNISDVSTLLDMLSAGESNRFYSINGDMTLNISDVSTLLDMLSLGEHQHDYLEIAYGRSCTEDRYIVEKCRICGYGRFTSFLKASEHVYTETLSVTNDSTYPFSENGSILLSTNHTDGTASCLTVTANYACTLTLRYKSSCESNCDGLFIYKNGALSVHASGIAADFSEKCYQLSAGDVLTFKYSKDGSVSAGEDCAYLEILSVTEVNRCSRSVCSVCEEGYGAAHTPVTHSATQPTCTEDGRTVGSHCAVCNTLLTGQILPKTGHDLQNGVCRVCGENVVVIAEGSCTGNIHWELYGNSEVQGGYDLFLSGTGAMNDEMRASDLPWYAYRADIRCVTVSNGITHVGRYAFAYCDALAEVTLGQEVTDIGRSAFVGCTALTRINLNAVSAIGEEAFRDCSALDEIHLNNANRVDAFAFCGCTALTEVTLPECVSTLGAHAFDGCSALKKVTVSSDVTDIGTNPFSNCPALECIFDNGIECNAILQNGVLVAGCKNTVIPSNVTAIGDCAFEGCTALTDLTVPNGVQKIGALAFDGCSALVRIKIGSGVTAMESRAFEGCNALRAVEIVSIAQWCRTSFGYHSNPLSYAGVLYKNGEIVTDLIIPAEVTSISDRAFYGCESIKSISFGRNVKRIGGYAFYGCDALTCLTVPDGVTQIDGYAFADCTALNRIVLPDSVTEIGSAVFANCGAIKRIEGSGTVDNCIVRNGVLIAGCINSVIPADGSVTAIGDYAFSHCAEMVSITLPESVISIGDAAFYACISLTHIHYGGMPAQWDELTKGNEWDAFTGHYTVYTTDGTLPK